MDPLFTSISLRDAGTALLDLAMPRRCIVCQRPLSLRERFLCLPCMADFPFTHYWELSRNPMADKFNALIQEDLDSSSGSGTDLSFSCPFGSVPDGSGTNPPFLCPFLSFPDGSGTNSPFLCPSCPSPDGLGTNLPFLCPFRSFPDGSGTDSPLLCSSCPSPDRLGTDSSDLCPPGRPGGPPPDCPHCRHEPYAFAAALFFYNSSSDYRHIPWHLKYEGGLAAGRHFASMLGERLAASPQFADVDVVIPVPLHWTRQWRRGYNQAEVIARELASTLGAELRTDILRRSRRTRSQVRLPMAAKSANVRGAFSLARDMRGASTRYDTKAPYSAAHVLLVDDTFTTGSTLNACRAVLQQAFPLPTRISVATLAYVSRD